MKNDKKYNAIKYAFVAAALIGMVVYVWQLIMLHYNQTLFPETGLYESDLYAHIEMALDGWGYSLVALVIKVLSLIPNEKLFHFLLATVLAVVEAATVSATYYFVRKKNLNTVSALAIAAISAFVMPFYIKGIQPYRYIGYQSGNIWHNSTYIAMKLAALMCVTLYLKISDKYREEMNVKDVIAFAILLMTATGIKTNFLLAFAPAALLFLVVDLCRGTSFKRILICAATVIPSLLVLVFQKVVLFGDDTGNGVIIDPLYSAYLRADKPYFTMILSALFPVFVFLFEIVPALKNLIADFKEKKGNFSHRMFWFSWTMWFVSFAEFLLLRETGSRELDDNFAWGYDFSLFFVFLVSLIIFFRNIASNTNIKNKYLRIAYAVSGGAILFYQIYCGLYFFIELTKGATFFMQ